MTSGTRAVVMALIGMVVALSGCAEHILRDRDQAYVQVRAWEAGVRAAVGGDWVADDRVGSWPCSIRSHDDGVRSSYVRTGTTALPMHEVSRRAREYLEEEGLSVQLRETLDGDVLAGGDVVARSSAGGILVLGYSRFGELTVTVESACTRGDPQDTWIPPSSVPSSAADRLVAW